MMCGLTGTPGTGKSAIAAELERRGHRVVRLNDLADQYLDSEDEDRDARIIDVDRMADEFVPVDGFIEGHFAHVIPCDRIVVLRCRPDELRKRLKRRAYSKGKIRENVEAEALDCILCETVDEYDPHQILELDTTSRDPVWCADQIEQFVKGEIPASFGQIDWSGYLEVK
ncbi:MAG: adenylate kinase family protein [Methanoregula sp.]|jgi:adenylate kinase